MTEAERIAFVRDHYNYCYLESLYHFLEGHAADVLISGLSYGLDTVETSWPENRVLNFSMHSQDIYYDYVHLKHILQGPYSAAIHTYILTLGYYSLHYDLSLGSNRNICLELYYPLTGDAHHMRIPEGFSVAPGYRDEECREFYRTFFELNGLSYYSDARKREDTAPGVTLRGGWPKLRETVREEEARRLAERHNRHYLHTDTFEENRIILGEMLQTLAERGIRIILLIPPFTPQYRRFIRKEYAEILMSEADAISFQVELIDMNESDLFDTEDYLDADHLNQRGAEKATAILRSVLDANGREMP